MIAADPDALARPPRRSRTWRAKPPTIWTTSRNIKSIDDFLGNDRLFAFAMKAFGLEDMAYAKAFMRKVLTEGIDNNDSLRQQARPTSAIGTSPRPSTSRATADDDDRFDRRRQGTVDRYVRQTLEENAGTRTKACGSRSISSARRDASRVPTASSPTRRCSRWCRRRLACRRHRDWISTGRRR